MGMRPVQAESGRRAPGARRPDARGSSRRPSDRLRLSDGGRLRRPAVPLPTCAIRRPVRGNARSGVRRHGRSGDVVAVPPVRPYRGRDTTVFDRGEGAWISRNVLYFSTTSNDRVWALDLGSTRMEVIYDRQGADAGDPLHEPDNVTVHEPTVTRSSPRTTTTSSSSSSCRPRQAGRRCPSCSSWGTAAPRSRGPVFSLDARRLYVSSQRGRDGDGMTFEITGPFARR